MENSVIDYLEKRSKECEDILECIAGFGHLEKKTYLKMIENKEPMTVDEVANSVDRERSTAFRALNKLEENGFAKKETEGLEGGSYIHVYEAVLPKEVSKEMRERVDEWQNTVDAMIDEFEQKYSD